MYLQRDTQFLLNNEITWTIPFYLHHSRSWATLLPSLYHFPLKRALTIFLYFDTPLINWSCFAPFAFCSGLSLQIRDKWTSNDLKTNLKKEISNLPWNTRQWPLLVSFLRIIFFIGSFENFYRIKQGKFYSEKVWFWFQIEHFCEKLSVMCLNGVQSCLQHLATSLYYSKSCF